MHEIAESFSLAVQLLVSFDPDMIEIIGLSLHVSLAAVAVATLFGLPLGALLAISRFWGRGAVIVTITALMGLPPVAVGLFVYLLLSGAGVLGPLQLLYTPTAMIVAQTLLVLPIIIALTRQAIEELHGEYHEQFTLFGLSRVSVLTTLLWEGRYGLLTTLLAGFGRAIAEVGAVIIVGGNINHVTRVMTTAIALETSRGNLALALGLGIVLVLLAIAINTAVLSLGATSARAGHG